MHAVRMPDVVSSLAGHDRGREYVVLKTDGAFVWLADGKIRKLNNPKRKSLRHLSLGKMGSQELADVIYSGRVTDSVIRKELAKFRFEACMTEEGREFVKR